MKSFPLTLKKLKSMGEWMEYKMDEIALIVDCEHRTAPLVDVSDFYSVRTSNIATGKIDYESCNRVSEETYYNWTKREKPFVGDIILAREAPVGEVGIVKSGYNVCLGQRTVLIRVNNPAIHNIYLLYYLVNPTNKIALIEKSGGSVVSHLNMKDIRSHFIKAPIIEEQTAIASALKSLDDKIDLLHRQNATLKKIAETLFRKWFVEDAKEEWETDKLGNIAFVQNGYAFSSKAYVDYNPNHLEVFKMGHIKRGGGLRNNPKKDFVPREDNLSRWILKKGDIVMAMTDMKDNVVILGVPAMIDKDNWYVLNQRVARLYLKSNSRLINSFLLYIQLKDPEFIALLQSKGNSGVQVNLSTESIKDCDIIIPPLGVQNSIGKTITDLYLKKEHNHNQIRTLTKLRDTLLPKLMSGEVRVEI